MSRLTEPTIKDGDAINAASLNDRFTQFSQSGALDQFNTRDAAVDLPHMVAGAGRFLTPAMATTTIGHNDWKHGVYNTYTGQTTGAAPYVVQDITPADTVLSLGPLGFTIEPDVHLLRVYWDLSVRPRWEGTKPWNGGALYFTLPATGGGTVNVFSGYGCWAFWLQWDITSNALTNFVNVPSQLDFNTIVTGTRGGNPLSACDATSVLQNVVEYGDAADEGTIAGSIVDTPVGWSSTSGSWHYAPTPLAVTVYGLRVVFTGPLGAHNGGGVNYLVRNDSVASAARLDVQAGALQAMMMRVK
jgi:hypothetical protein